MPDSFDLLLPPRIRFGSGVRATLGPLAAAYGRRCLLVTGGASLDDAGHLRGILDGLREAGLAIVDARVSGEPSPALVDGIVARYRGTVDIVVAIGGGSVLDSGKAVAAMLACDGPVKEFLEKVGSRKPSGDTLPLIAVPTTAGTGSEATKNAVISEVGPEGFKASLRHDNYVPRAALVDPQLHLSCPRAVTAACGMDAFTQLLEAYVSTGATAATDALAWSGLECASRALLLSAGAGAEDVSVRGDMAYAATMSGVVLANAGLGVVHGIAGVLGGLVDVPHGVACGTLLPEATAATIEVLRGTAPHSPAIRKYARTGRLIAGEPGLSDHDACDTLVETLRAWSVELQLPRLAAYGVNEEMAGVVAKTAGNKNNPCELDESKRKEIVDCRL